MADQQSGRHGARPRMVCATAMQDVVGVLEGRWKMMILAHLLGQPAMRFSDLQRAIPGVSQKVLTQQLRGLERDGVVARTVYPEVPPRVEYRLTDDGHSLRPVFLALLDWAECRVFRPANLGLTHIR